MIGNGESVHFLVGLAILVMLVVVVVVDLGWLMHKGWQGLV